MQNLCIVSDMKQIYELTNFMINMYFNKMHTEMTEEESRLMINLTKM